ncbi:MAG: hypothetical protein RLZZ427_1506 [Pseudomonadota bacterium]|jgi:hypothetical protein
MGLLTLPTVAVKDAFRLWRFAPWVPLIALIPEFAQHIVEIKLGMFVSLEAFKALQNDSLRWSWGYGKLAGLAIAIMCGLFALATLEKRAILWPRVGLALVFNVAVTAPVPLIDRLPTESAKLVANIALSVLTLPILVYTVGAVLGEDRMTFFEAIRTGWWAEIRMLFLIVPGFGLLQLVHMLDHFMVMGAAPWLVWTGMLWDSLVVGMLATWMAVGLYRGYLGAGK